MDTLLNTDQQRILLDLAHRAVVQRVSGVVSPVPVDLELPAASGVFVTVKARGALRGCLGTLECHDLQFEVSRCAANAASADPRFAPLAADELADVSIQVSVLGPLERIDPCDETAIEIGRHGLVIEQGRRRGLLLPQVAPEWNWTREQFLQHTAAKAGLDRDAWRRGATVYRFEAQVFGQ